MRAGNFLRTAGVRSGMILVAFLGSMSLARAESLAALGLNTTLSYDIYVGSEDKAAVVIKDVSPLRIAEIDAASFLVIEIAGFNLKQYEGFIRLDKIMAILPHDKIDVDKIDYIESK